MKLGEIAKSAGLRVEIVAAGGPARGARVVWGAPRGLELGLRAGLDARRPSVERDVRVPAARPRVDAN